MTEHYPQGFAAARAVYRRLLRYVSPYWKIFAASIFCMVIFALTDTAFAYLMQPMLDGGFAKRDSGMVRTIAFMIILLFMARGVLHFLSTYGMTWVSRQVIKDLRAQMFVRMIHLPNYFFDHTSSGHLISKFSYDVEQVAEASTTVITILAKELFTVLGLLAWMFYLNWLLALVFVTAGPFVAVIIVQVNRRLRRISHRIQVSMGNVVHIVEEAIKAQQVIKIFGGEKYEQQRFDKENKYNQHMQMKMAVTSAVSAPLMQMIAACALAGIIYLASMESVLSKVTVGTFVSYMTAMLMLMPPLKRLTNINTALQKGIVASHSIFQLLDEKTEEKLGTISTLPVKQQIVFDAVGFTYEPSKAQTLSGINFTVACGKSVALVGRSGSGKTTLMKLLTRLYPLTHGKITIDGVDINTLELKSLRRCMAMVSQDVVLFNDTIYNNVAYAMDNVTEEQVVSALEVAYALEFVEKLPQGMQTLVGENGVLLSGGQRQRLAIARAIVKNAPILILDEATSALDNESERYIKKALENLMQNRTTLIIAHRLTTIESADLIVVLDQGHLVEMGQHQELLTNNGHYAALHRHRFSEA